jgi:hypothetical protein
MSQPPISYESPTMYTPAPPRPTILTVLAIIGIVFGAVGVLCLGFGDLMNLFMLASPAMARAINQPRNVQTSNLIIGTFGLIFSAALLAASIGAINLKPAARRWMIRWAAADLLYDVIKLVVAVAILVPQAMTSPAVQQSPMGPQMATWGKLSGIISAILTWAVTTTYAALVFVFFRKPEIVNAFENPPQNPNASVSLPIPPM